MHYDFVVVGAGLFGAALARELTDRGRRVLVVDGKPHLGGACYTEKKHGIIVHTYGPHVFHTNDDRIWAWVNRFADFKPFTVRTKAVSGHNVYTLPINLMTLNQLWGVVTPAEARLELERVRVKIENPETIEQLALATWGADIYRKFIYSYTVKQWGRDPAQLPAAILKRLPVRLNFDDNYFDDRYQGIPADGYTPMFEKMLSGIDVSLNVDFFDDRQRLEAAGVVVYSGRVDKFFGNRFGPLEFRSCRFDSELSMVNDLQGNPVIHWLDPYFPWTRTIEHKHFHPSAFHGTIVTKETPFECGPHDMPLYPINDKKNEETMRRYLEISTPAIFGGRLGSYRYRDMHQVVAEAISLASRIS